MLSWCFVHYYDELSHYGIEIETFDYANYESIAAANEVVIKQARNEHYDLFMTGCNEEALYIDTVLQLKALGLPTLLLCCDNLSVPFVHRNIARYFDLVWLCQPDNREMFEKWGARTLCQPFAANPFFFQYRQKEELYRAAFVGTPYGTRANMINTLTSNSVPVTLFTSPGGTSGAIDGGAGHRIRQLRQIAKTTSEFLRFPNGRKLLAGAAIQKLHANARLDTSSAYLEIRPSVTIDEMPVTYSTYALALAGTTARNTGTLKHPVEMIFLRNFEIPMSGGVQLCFYEEELAGYFEEDKEILFYRSDEEFVEKAKFYLAPKRAQLRQDLRLAARRRAENEHTWYRRFSKVFETLDITAKAE